MRCVSQSNQVDSDLAVLLARFFSKLNMEENLIKDLWKYHLLLNDISYFIIHSLPALFH